MIGSGYPGFVMERPTFWWRRPARRGPSSSGSRPDDRHPRRPDMSENPPAGFAPIAGGPDRLAALRQGVPEARAHHQDRDSADIAYRDRVDDGDKAQGGIDDRREPRAGQQTSRPHRSFIYKIRILRRLLDRYSGPTLTLQSGLTLAEWRVLTNLYSSSPTTSRQLCLRLHTDKAGSAAPARG
jgi:hypothetical protein